MTQKTEEPKEVLQLLAPSREPDSRNLIEQLVKSVASSTRQGIDEVSYLKSLTRLADQKSKRKPQRKSLKDNQYIRTELSNNSLKGSTSLSPQNTISVTMTSATRRKKKKQAPVLARSLVISPRSLIARLQPVESSSKATKNAKQKNLGKF